MFYLTLELPIVKMTNLFTDFIPFNLIVTVNFVPDSKCWEFKIKLNAKKSANWFHFNNVLHIDLRKTLCYRVMEYDVIFIFVSRLIVFSEGSTKWGIIKENGFAYSDMEQSSSRMPHKSRRNIESHFTRQTT